jgi:hypothetical protein
MPDEGGAEYFARRAREEREKAENASNPAIYKAHLELAREYERRAIQASSVVRIDTVTESSL